MTDIVEKWKKVKNAATNLVQTSQVYRVGDEMCIEIGRLRERPTEINAELEMEVRRLRKALAEVKGARLGIGNAFTVNTNSKKGTR